MIPSGQYEGQCANCLRTFEACIYFKIKMEKPGRKARLVPPPQITANCGCGIPPFPMQQVTLFFKK